MNSSVSWNAGGLSPELYQAAREAAHRAGMSVEDWLRSTFGDSAVASMRQQSSGPLGARLGELSQRFGHAAEAEPAPLSARGARLSDTVAKLNARLDQMTASRPGAPASQAATTAPSLAPKAEPRERDIDEVIAEIAARQRALDAAPEQTSRARAPPLHPLPMCPHPRPRRCLPRFRAARAAASAHHASDRVAAPAFRRRRRDRRAAPRPRRRRARRAGRLAAPHTGKPAGRREPARRADQSRLWPRRRSVTARDDRAQPCRGA